VCGKIEKDETSLLPLEKIKKNWKVVNLIVVFTTHSNRSAPTIRTLFLHYGALQIGTLTTYIHT